MLCTHSLTVQGNVGGIRSLALPNGTSYTFYYGSDNPDPSLSNPYGLLSEVIYPDGGWVKYTWKLSDNLSSVAIYAGLGAQPPSTAYPNICTLQYSTPVVATRQVGFGSGGAVLTQTFTYNTAWDSTNKQWTSKTTNVTTTDNVLGKSSLTVYSYSPNYGWSPDPLAHNQIAIQIPVENTLTTYDWNSSTTPVQTVTKSWAAPNQLRSVQTTYNNNATSQITYFPHALLPTEVDEYDFNQSSPYRKTLSTYQSFAGLAGILVDRPCKVVVEDHNGTTVSETDSYYDGAGTLCGTSSGESTAVVPGLPANTHDEDLYGPNSSTPRGNLTKQVSWSNAGNSPTSTYSYDETGQMISAIDPCGNGSCSEMSGANHTTTFSYSDSPSGGNPAGNSNAYLTTLTRPATGSVNHVEQYQYDYPTGALTSSTDENSQITTYQYNDSLRRLTDTYSPPSAQNNGSKPHTQYQYADGPNPTITAIDPVGVTRVTKFDGIGHVTQTQMSSDPAGADSIDTTYDGTGRPYTVSNPHRPSSLPSDGTTTFAYDILGRTTLLTNPDGSTVHSSYNGNVTTVTDETNHSWQRTSDAFGRLVNVTEPGNLVSTYTYNESGNLVGVTQNGISGETPRTRSFTYDSLSRLICASSPENSQNDCPMSATTALPSGVSGYSYDPNGNLSSKTDARNVTTTYAYDALNRLTSKRYSGEADTAHPTLSACYLYDSEPNPGSNTISRIVSEWTQSGACPASATGVPATAISWKDSISYDPMGRTTDELQCAFAPCSAPSPLHYIYDLAGNLTYSTNGLANSQSPQVGWTNTFDSAGRLSKVSTTWDDATHPAILFKADQLIGDQAPYGPFGLTAAQIGVSSQSPQSVALSENLGYDTRGRLTSKAVLGGSAGTPGPLIPQVTVTPNPLRLGGAAIMTTTVACHSCGSGSWTIDGLYQGGFTFDDNGTVSGNFGSNLGLGTHVLTVHYGGNSIYPPSDSVPLNLEIVTPAAPTVPVVMTVVPDPITAGQSVTVTSSVGYSSGSGAGNWSLDTVYMGGFNYTASQSQTFALGSNLSVGSHTVTVNYSGTPDYAPSSGLLLLASCLSFLRSQ